MLRRRRGGDHREQRQVDAIRAGGEDAELASLLAAVHQELASILEIVALDNFAQDALSGNGRAVCRHHQCYLALRHDGHRHLEDPVLPTEITEMQPRSQRVGLEAGLTGQREQAARRQRTGAEFFDDDSDLPLADQNRAQHQRPNQYEAEQHHCRQPELDGP